MSTIYALFYFLRDKGRIEQTSLNFLLMPCKQPTKWELCFHIFPKNYLPICLFIPRNIFEKFNSKENESKNIRGKSEEWYKSNQIHCKYNSV